MKTKQSQIDTIGITLSDLSDHRFLMLTAVAGKTDPAQITDTDLQDPTNYTVASQYSGANAPDISAAIPQETTATDQGATMLLEWPNVDVDFNPVAGSGFNVVAWAIVDNATLSSTTRGRVGKLAAAKNYSVGDIPRLSDFAVDTTEK